MCKNKHLDTFSNFFQVSRETIISLNKYEEKLIKSNQNLNLIGKSTINQIWTRHFLDSAQVIDFVDKNDKTLIDIGSGAGFPGLVLGIMAKDRKIPLKIKLIEKSPKKIMFLKEIISELKINAEVLDKNIFDYPKKISEDIIAVRAFKPFQIILELIHNQAENWKKIFIYLGKTGKNELLQASKIWDIEYKQRVSITSNDSIVLEIRRIKKK